MSKADGRPSLDKRRQTYKIFFPSELTPEQVAKFINGTGGSMHRKGGLFNMSGPPPSTVYEIFGSGGRITHWVKVPWEYVEDIVPPLLTLVPGAKLVPNNRLPEDERYEVCAFTDLVEVGAKNSHRQFQIDDPEALSTNILTRFDHLAEGEKLRMQFVVTPAAREEKPVHGEAMSREFRWQSLYHGPLMASKNEVYDRGQKQQERTFYVALRIGAVASTKTRATHLATKVVSALKSTHGASNYFVDRWWVRGVQHRMDAGAGPEPTNLINPPIILNVSELTAFLGWRLGNPLVTGLEPTVARSLAAPTVVPETGGIIGRSTFGRERPIAIPYSERTKHVYISGSTGSGKTTLAENLIGQDMRAGHGVIVIDGKGDMFSRGLDQVPRDQIDNTIVVDFSDQTFAVGFNLLQQGNPSIAIDELNTIFNKLFKDRESMWMQEVLDQTLRTLAPNKQSTFMNVRPLLMPKPYQKPWAEHLKRTVPDREIREWWEEFDHDDPRSRSLRDQKIQPLRTRLWPMMRSPLINVFGQAQSRFSMADVIRNHMNLFINVTGLEEMSKRLAATIFVNAAWQAVQANPVEKPNFIYLDEFQDILELISDPRDMLAKSRSFGLGMVLANQYIGQLTDDMRDAILSNVQTKLIMHSENPTDNHRLAASFGKMVTPEDFSMLGRYEVLARIATPSGTSTPLTLTTLPPRKSVGLGARARAASHHNYAKRVDQIREEMETKYSGYVKTTKSQRPTVSGSEI